MNTDGRLLSEPIDLGPRYVFECVLGRGGMGVVLRAQDTLLNRAVAVKVLSDELAGNPEAQDIFLTESRSLATLSHPNLVGIYDVTQIDGRAMMVFEFVEGKTLEAMFRERGPLPEAEVIRMAMDLCRVIGYLHDKNVIHRDLKPANVMMQPNGKITLIDFGLARSLEDIAERGTRVRGSPAYMAPEQVTGEHLGHHTDIYALGMTLFELLAGRLPFEGGDMSFAQVYRYPPSLGTMREGLHPDLVAVVDSCIAKFPSERPSSAAAVLGMLEGIAQDLASGTRPSKPRLTAPKVGDAPHPTAAQEIHRNRGLIGVLGIITVAFVVVLVGMLMRLERSSTPSTSAPVEEPALVVENKAPVEVQPKPQRDEPKPAPMVLPVAETMSRMWVGIAAARTAADAVATKVAKAVRPAKKTERMKLTERAPSGVIESSSDVEEDVVNDETPGLSTQAFKPVKPVELQVPTAAMEAPKQSTKGVVQKTRVEIRKPVQKAPAEKKPEVAPPVSF